MHTWCVCTASSRFPSGTRSKIVNVASPVDDSTEYETAGHDANMQAESTLRHVCTSCCVQLFISKEHEKGQYGENSPGPVTGQFVSSIGIQTLSVKSSAPSWGFGTGKVSLQAGGIRVERKVWSGELPALELTQ